MARRLGGAALLAALLALRTGVARAAFNATAALHDTEVVEGGDAVLVRVQGQAAAE